MCVSITERRLPVSGQSLKLMVEILGRFVYAQMVAIVGSLAPASRVRLLRVYGL